MHYEPAEDSELLAEQVKRYARGTVLDMGTGSGIQARTAAKKTTVTKVIATDIDKNALTYARKNTKSKKITFKQTNLFSKIKGEFDTIIFNPPYLPTLKGEEKQTALHVAGGKKGHEILERFIKNAGNHLKHNGIMLILFSSLTNKELVDSIIEQNGFNKTQLSKQNLFTEQLYTYKLTWKLALAEVKRKVTNIQYLTKGKRGMIFTGTYRKKKVAIKIKRKTAETDRIHTEALWLKKLNKHNIGPKLCIAARDYVVYDFVSGKFILDYIEKSTKTNTKKVLRKVLKQCITLDELKINKEEMHHPVKHILVGKKVVMLDFERAHYTTKPKNTTQFLQFLTQIKQIKLNKTKLITLGKRIKNNDRTAIAEIKKLLT